ncbi:beta-ketoacyl-ACP synthase III [Mucisphaera calidilacus]|uniref:Beta-ketoacyl-[acyl-carrier-protein] synthase III n=1 Tax=Mucisphaera calidilacus TaxID=2527982 RepID=A0A518BVU6_9BACT|nr:beta-ketoacyl-ACP synthase III [Mucisphaera calidilacus]QDU71102.1 3-oxoacyl-[acyl-carrier-protein] synthase 3 [Mucisphaera calidilacus]
MITRTGTGRGVRLAGTGLAVPDRVLTNQDLSRIVDTNDEWITQRTGIQQRRIAAGDQTVVDLGADAMREALDQAKIEPDQLDLVILATMTPEMACPSSAAQLVSRLGAVPAGAMDLSAACSGFVYALNLAAGLIQSGHASNIGVVGAETLSRVVDFTDRRTCVLFGDGAGAAVVTADDNPERGCLYQTMRSDGDRWRELYLPRHEGHIPVDGAEGVFSGNFNTIQMNGREIFKFAVTTTQAVIDETLEKSGVTSDELAMVIPHQSNLRILEAARTRLKLPPEKFCINIDRYGNTSAASVPIALHEQRTEGRIADNDYVLFLAIGGGLTWTTSLWRF